MSIKPFLALVLVTLAALAGAIWTSQDRTRVVLDERAGERLLPDLAARANDVARIAVTHKGVAVTVTASAEGWIMPDRGDFPVRPEAVGELVGGLAQVTVVEAMTGVPDRFARLDVQDPTGEQDNGRRVVLAAADGSVLADVVVGRSTASLGGGSGVYVRDVAAGRAFLVQGRVQIPLDGPSWLDRQLIDVPMDDVMSVRLDGGPSAPIALSRTTDGGLRLDGLGEGQSVETTEANRLLGALARMSFEDVRPATGAAQASADGRHATFTTRDGLVLRFTPHTDGERRLWRIEAGRAPDASADAGASVEDRIRHVEAIARDRLFVLPSWTLSVFDLPADRLVRASNS